MLWVDQPKAAEDGEEHGQAEPVACEDGQTAEPVGDLRHCCCCRRRPESESTHRAQHTSNFFSESGART